MNSGLGITETMIVSLAWSRGQSIGLRMGGFTNKQLCDLGKKLSSESLLFPRAKELIWRFYKILSNSTIP